MEFYKYFKNTVSEFELNYTYKKFPQGHNQFFNKYYTNNIYMYWDSNKNSESQNLFNIKIF